MIVSLLNFRFWFADMLEKAKGRLFPACLHTKRCTVLVLRMAHRKLKESKQLPSMLPGPAVLGCCLLSFHILWAILSTSTVYFSLKGSMNSSSCLFLANGASFTQPRRDKYALHGIYERPAPHPLSLLLCLKARAARTSKSAFLYQSISSRTAAVYSIYFVG